MSPWPVDPSADPISFELSKKGDALAGLEAPSNLRSEHQRWEDDCIDNPV